MRSQIMSCWRFCCIIPSGRGDTNPVAHALMQHFGSLHAVLEATADQLCEVEGVGPRTAIGQRKDGTVLLLVIDGRQPGYSVGATLRDLQNIMYEEGAVIAANLDGGSSSTLYYNGKVINKPADLLGERMIPTAFVVK